MTDGYTLDRRRINLAETLDRVLTKGAVITGDITISVADVDLIYLQLRILLASVETAFNMQDGIDKAKEMING